jgi:hypothetical protein
VEVKALIPDRQGVWVRPGEGISLDLSDGRTVRFQPLDCEVGYFSPGQPARAFTPLDVDHWIRKLTFVGLAYEAAALACAMSAALSDVLCHEDWN